MNDDAPIVEYGEPIDPKSIIEPTDPDTLELRETAQPGDRVLFAGKLGNVRLLDNIMLEADIAAPVIMGI